MSLGGLLVPLLLLGAPPWCTPEPEPRQKGLSLVLDGLSAGGYWPPSVCPEEAVGGLER